MHNAKIYLYQLKSLWNCMFTSTRAPDFIFQIQIQISLSTGVLSEMEVETCFPTLTLTLNIYIIFTQKMKFATS